MARVVLVEIAEDAAVCAAGCVGGGAGFWAGVGEVAGSEEPGASQSPALSAPKLTSESVLPRAFPPPG
eukprot:9919292-Lingulodinium_polyedra.AAC.1